MYVAFTNKNDFGSMLDCIGFKFNVIKKCINTLFLWLLQKANLSIASNPGKIEENQRNMWTEGEEKKVLQNIKSNF